MKKSIAILLTIAVMLSPFSVGFFSISALAVSEVVSGAGISAIIGIMSSILGHWLANEIGQNGWKLDLCDSQFVEAVNSIAQNRFNEIINVEDYAIENDTLLFRFTPASGLTGDTLEMAEFVCNRLNNSNNLQELTEYFRQLYSGIGGGMKASTYMNLKNDAINAYRQWAARKGLLEDNLKGAQAAAEAGLFPDIYSDWTGPVDPYQLPTQSSYISLTSDGYVYSTPDIVVGEGGRYASKHDYYIYGLKYCGSYDTLGNKTYYSVWEHEQGKSEPIYETGTYIIYNGNVYRYTYEGGKEKEIYWVRVSTETIGTSNLKWFYDNNGISALDAGCNTVIGLQSGIYVTKKPPSQLTVENISEQDFIETTGGGTIEAPPLSDEEAAIQEAIAAGLLPEDFMLKLNELGQIIAANNIPIEKLQSLLEQLKDGQMHFEDFESYLQYISALLSAGNVDRQTSAQILKNIKSLQEQTNNNIGVVNTTISGLKELDEERNNSLAQINANIAALTEALTAAQEGDITKENADLDAVIGNHVGLSEANQFVSNWALMNQFKGLMYNVLDRYDKSGSDPPNFNFYWDSNKDGESEKYTFLDLSILETTLSNNNLEDKGRFKNEMTVREFIQFLIILVCYVAFIIKMFRKLPGLVSGGESSMDTGFELGKAQKEQTARTLKSLGKGD